MNLIGIFHIKKHVYLMNDIYKKNTCILIPYSYKQDIIKYCLNDDCNK
jgi:hypothetical protein